MRPLLHGVGGGSWPPTSPMPLEWPLSRGAGRASGRPLRPVGLLDAPDWKLVPAAVPLPHCFGCRSHRSSRSRRRGGPEGLPPGKQRPRSRRLGCPARLHTRRAAVPTRAGLAAPPAGPTHRRGRRGRRGSGVRLGELPLHEGHGGLATPTTLRPVASATYNTPMPSKQPPKGGPHGGLATDAPPLPLLGAQRQGPLRAGGGEEPLSLPYRLGLEDTCVETHVVLPRHPMGRYHRYHQLCAPPPHQGPHSGFQRQHTNDCPVCDIAHKVAEPMGSSIPPAAPSTVGTGLHRRTLQLHNEGIPQPGCGAQRPPYLPPRPLP